MQPTPHNVPPAPEWFLAGLEFLGEAIMGIVIYTLYWGAFQLVGLIWEKAAFGWTDKFLFGIVIWGLFCIITNLKNRSIALNSVDKS